MNIDAVAEAICNAAVSAECLHWRYRGELTRDSYRRMAQAAIDAMHLTEETRTAYIGVGKFANPIHPKNYQDQRRLVSPWVEVSS